MSDAPPSAPRKQRLHFIDLARSIAILLMLEGHFVGLTLADSSRDPGHPVYAVWQFVRGFSAPLFFTVSGMIFVFLLSGERELGFFRSKRVRKGLWRAAELLFWGYVLQLDAKRIPEYLAGGWGDWVCAFHVLQCIGCGLLGLIAMAGLQQAVGRLRLEWWYGAAVVVLLVGYAWLKGLPEGVFVPAGWPELVQNAVRGPRSVFPVMPWLGFAFLGGAMGAYLRSLDDTPVTGKSCLWFFLIGVAMQLVHLVSLALPLTAGAHAGIAWFTQRAFQVVVFLGILRWIEIRHGIDVKWLLRTGRETFAIYIVHVIVLYGGIFGIGLNDWLDGALGPWQAAGAALVFLAVFVVHAQWLHRWKSHRRGRIGSGKGRGAV